MPTFPHPLKPCLVLGTGFHQWVLGESMRQDFKALHSWPTLLLQVAKALGVALDSRQDHLSLLWEQLLTTAVHDGLQPDGQPTLAPNAHHPRHHPCGIEPLVCSDWNEGWAQVQAWAGG